MSVRRTLLLERFSSHSPGRTQPLTPFFLPAHNASSPVKFNSALVPQWSLQFDNADPSQGTTFAYGKKCVCCDLWCRANRPPTSIPAHPPTHTRTDAAFASNGDIVLAGYFDGALYEVWIHNTQRLKASAHSTTIMAPTLRLFLPPSSPLSPPTGYGLVSGAGTIPPIAGGSSPTGYILSVKGDGSATNWARVGLTCLRTDTKVGGMFPFVSG